jgi:hypothetical protein
MTFWERWLAPGDIRAQLRRERSVRDPKDSTLQIASITTSPMSETRPVRERLNHTQREWRKGSIFLGGLAFAIASLTLTRRALRKRLYLPTPPFYQPSHNTLPTVSGGMEAVDALFLATLNVTAIGMAAVGTFMVGWDVAEVEDLRAAVNRGAGFDVYGGDKEADREMEGWVQEMFAKKKDDALDSGDVENVQVGVKEMMEQGGLIAKLGRLASLAEEREERKKQENIENGPASTQQGRALA